MCLMHRHELEENHTYLKAPTCFWWLASLGDPVLNDRTFPLFYFFNFFSLYFKHWTFTSLQLLAFYDSFFLIVDHFHQSTSMSDYYLCLAYCTSPSPLHKVSKAHLRSSINSPWVQEWTNECMSEGMICIWVSSFSSFSFCYNLLRIFFFKIKLISYM